MELRSFMRPFPLLVLFLFVAVAVGDLVQSLCEEPLPPPKLLRPGAVFFEPREPVIDLRSGSDDPDVRLLPEPVLAGPMWATAGTHGIWMLGDGARFEIDVLHGGFRMMVLEGRPAVGKRPVGSVGLSVNGVDCGIASLRRGWQRFSLTLPEGVLHAGTNEIVFRIPDREGSQKARRALQLRRIELRLEDDPVSEARPPVPLSVDFESRSVVIFSSGVLETRFSVDDRVDALRMSYRFSGAGGSGELTVARPQGGGAGNDASVRHELSHSKNEVGRIRVPLHGRRGEFLLRLRLDAGPGQSRLDISSLELVKERNRTGAEGDRRR